MHIDTASNFLVKSKVAFKLVFNEASPDSESQSNIGPTISASSHLDCFMQRSKLAPH